MMWQLEQKKRNVIMNVFITVRVIIRANLVIIRVSEKKGGKQNTRLANKLVTIVYPSSPYTIWIFSFLVSRGDFL